VVFVTLRRTYKSLGIRHEMFDAGKSPHPIPSALVQGIVTI
jgi:hypothetical protein